MLELSADARFFASQPVQLIDSGRARIAVRRFGAGPPVLFIHGWPLHGATYRKLVRQLAARHTCVVVDLAGAGESDWQPDNDFSFHGHAEHLKHVMDTLALGSYRLIAHDTGATVARRLAIIDAEHAGDLVLIDTEIPHHRPPLVPTLQKVMALPGANFVFRSLMRSRRYLRSGSGFGGCFVDKGLIDGEFHQLFVAPLLASPRRTAGQLRYARGISWSQLDGLAEGHARIPGRVLLLWGARDPFFPIARARQMLPQFRDARLIEIPDAKLLPHEERPDVVLGHIDAFFA